MNWIKPGTLNTIPPHEANIKGNPTMHCTEFCKHTTLNDLCSLNKLPIKLSTRLYTFDNLRAFFYDKFSKATVIPMTEFPLNYLDFDAAIKEIIHANFNLIKLGTETYFYEVE